MKRSGTVNLAVMGALAFTASFAGGSAYMRWPSAPPSQACTPNPAGGAQTCSPSTRTSYWPAFHYWGSSERAAAPATTTAAPRLVSRAPNGSPTSPDATTRGGFGSSGRTTFRGSAAG